MTEGAPRTFGPYQVISPIGAGGMGEVFKARDTRLDRIVALKVPREQFSDRFQREARAIAALNHPHITTLYDVGPNFLVMEYVEGERLPCPLPVARALVYARQILEALEAAHRKGIVHRDLKPENILVTKNGVKLLDFGLAQMKSVVPAGEQTATMHNTTEGKIAGTLQYMAPEQLQGKAVDARSDIFAFGLVVYEMITGRRAFHGDNAASVISAIMTADPKPIADFQPDVPPALQQVIGLCLKKDPDDRWQSAADVRHALDLAETAVPTAVAAAEPVRRGRTGWWIAAAFLCGLVAALGGYRLTAPKPGEPGTFRPLTYSGMVYFPELSPDGKQVAFLRNGENDDNFSLYVQLVSGGNPVNLAKFPQGKVAWSPDSSQLAFTHGDQLYTVPALGGARKLVASLAKDSVPRDVAWAPNGAFWVVGTQNSGLAAIPAEGGKMRVLTKADYSRATDHTPAISPENDAVAFVRHTSTYNSQLFVLPIASDGSAKGDARQITEGVWDIGVPSWARDGKEIVFQGTPGSNNPSLWRIGRNGGKPRRMIVPNMVAIQPSIALHTDRLAYVAEQEETKIFKMAIGHGAHYAPAPLIQAIGYHSDLGVSPDGSRIAFASNRTGTKELWLANADGTNQTQLTSSNGPSVGSPRWSPDGKTIVFDGYASGSSDIYTVSVDGGKPVQVTTDKSNEVRPGWSHDGKWIYFSSDRNSKREVFKIPATGGNAERIADGFDAFETNDGRWLYVLNDGKLYRMRPDGTNSTVLPGGGIGGNYWTVGGKSAFVYDAEHRTLWRAWDTTSGATSYEKAIEFGENLGPQSGGLCFAVPPSENYVIYRRTTSHSTTLMLMENFR